MDNQFIDLWLNIIRNCNYDNTYKMAWAKAFVEIAIEEDYNDSNIGINIEISLKRIASKIIKYYWNQTIFFNLIQGSNPLKPPKVLALTKELINSYQEFAQSMQPVRYERICFIFEENDSLSIQYKNTINKIATTLKTDVSYRFLHYEGNKIDSIYDYKKGDDCVYIEVEKLRKLKENSLLIFDVINLRWALILETFNSTPRICKKVKIIDEIDIRRKPLNSYMRYLDMDNPDHLCFICGEKIGMKNLSIDHVIPWSYLYSDDIWNLVYTHRFCNSSKNNIIPSEQMIYRLEQRNNRLLDIIIENKVSDKIVEELRLAVNKNYVHKFWIACQG